MTIDDPVYLCYAAQIAEHPADPYTRRLMEDVPQLAVGAAHPAAGPDARPGKWAARA